MSKYLLLKLVEKKYLGSSGIFNEGYHFDDCKDDDDDDDNDDDDDENYDDLNAEDNE